MDEPFGALDPVTRANLQQELLRIQALAGKTIILVTHDIDEALLLGQRIVLMDKGRVVQQGSAQDFLLHPANAFVRDFVGQSDIGVRLLGLDTVASRVRPPQLAAGEPIAASATLREALSAFVARRVSSLPVIDAQGQLLGDVHFADLLQVAA